MHLLFSPFLSYIKGSLVNTSDSVSLFYYIVICKTDWNWKRVPKKCGLGPPQKCAPPPPPPTVLVRSWSHVKTNLTKNYRIDKLKKNHYYGWSERDCSRERQFVYKKSSWKEKSLHARIGLKLIVLAWTGARRAERRKVTKVYVLCTWKKDEVLFFKPVRYR